MEGERPAHVVLAIRRLVRYAFGEAEAHELVGEGERLARKRAARRVIFTHVRPARRDVRVAGDGRYGFVDFLAPRRGVH